LGKKGPAKNLGGANQSINKFVKVGEPSRKKEALLGESHGQKESEGWGGDQPFWGGGGGGANSSEDLWKQKVVGGGALLGKIAKKMEVCFGT